MNKYGIIIDMTTHTRYVDLTPCPEAMFSHQSSSSSTFTIDHPAVLTKGLKDHMVFLLTASSATSSEKHVSL